MTFSTRDRRAVVLGVIVLAGVFAVRLVVIPLVHSWVDARGRIATGGEALTDLQRQVRRVLGQRERLIRTYGPGAAKPLLDIESAPVSLLQSIQGVLGKAGFKPTDYQPQPARPLQVRGSRLAKGVLLVPLQVRGKCKLPQLAKCLAGMREAPTLILVERVTVANDAKKPGQLEVTLLLATLAEARRAGS